MTNNWVPNKSINNDLVQKYLNNSLTTKQLTNYGPNVQLLEQMIHKYFKINDNKSVVVVNNGSTAIQVLAAGIEYKNKQKITWATQSFTFPPSVQANLINTKIIDIDMNGGINLDEVDNTINGIIITNIFGNIVDISKYEIWAKNNNKFVIFDNAATSYTFYNGQNCLNYGTGCSISFHHTKPFGFGEGGAIIVDKKYENEIRCLINFGIGLTDNYYVDEGTNGKMSDISAVYIIQYLESNFDIIINKHRQLYKYFKEQLIKRNINYLKLFPSFHDEYNIVPACFPLLINIYDNKYEKELLENNIFCRKYYYPLKNTKNAQYIFDHILCIPCNIDMEFHDIDKILDIISLVYLFLNP